MKADAIFLFWAIKSTLITVPCNENVKQRQQGIFILSESAISES